MIFTHVLGLGQPWQEGRWALRGPASLGLQAAKAEPLRPTLFTRGHWPFYCQTEVLRCSAVTFPKAVPFPGTFLSPPYFLPQPQLPVGGSPSSMEQS